MRVLLLVLSLLPCLSVMADKYPKAVANSRKAVVSIITFKNGELQRSGLGVFAGEAGELFSSYSLFLNIDSAVAIDPAGKVRNITHVMGANELYDCIKLRVDWDKKISSMPIVDGSCIAGTSLFMVSYGAKKSGPIEPQTIIGVDTISGHFYYSFDVRPRPDRLSAPLVNSNGELVALVQPSAGDTTKNYAISASFFTDMKISSVNYNSEIFRNLGIRRALPSSQSEAFTCLHLSKMANSDDYDVTLDDYIATFPDSYEGYLLLAERLYLSEKETEKADAAWEQALKLSEKPDNVYYSRASTLLAATNIDSSDSLQVLTNMKAALEYYDKAISVSAEPLYVLQKGDLLFRLGDYSSAFDCYTSVYNTNMCDADLVLKAAKCKENLGEYDAALAQIDSLVPLLGNDYIAPSYLIKAQMEYRLGRYRDAVVDYNRFEENNKAALSAQFYFMREQAEYKAKMFQPALNDIETAIYLQPENIVYLIEKARLCYRVNLIDEAMRVLSDAQSLSPENPDVFYLKGRCHIIKGDKVSASECLFKAKEYGHPDADNILESLK